MQTTENDERMGKRMDHGVKGNNGSKKLEDGSSGDGGKGTVSDGGKM
jgi:hypothetical protein